MRFLLQQYDFRPQNGGGIVHSRQFVRNLHALGHETCAWNGAGGACEGVRGLSNRRRFIVAWATTDCVYFRVTTRCPRSRAPLPSRLLGSRAIRVWEFNAIPEFALCAGKPEAEVKKEKAVFRARRGECDLAVCVSPAIEEYVRSELGIARTWVASNGSDPSRFHPGVEPHSRMKAFRDCYNICWIGSWKLSWHRIDLVLEAARLMNASKEGADVRFHILGGERRTEGIPDNVYFHGNIDYDELPAWLAAMDVGLVTYGKGPGQYSSPLKLFDYMAMGLPVVSLSQKQVEMIFGEVNLNKLVVAEYDGGALLEKIREIRGDSDLIELCRRKFPELVRCKYNWRNIVEGITREVERVRAEKHANVPAVAKPMRWLIRKLERSGGY